jgi:glucokinase
MTTAPIVCIDVGGSSLKTGVIHKPGIPSGSYQVTPIDSDGDLTSIIDTFVQAIQSATPADIGGLALSFPGPFDYERGVCLIEAQRLHKYGALYKVNVSDVLRGRLGRSDLPIRYRNDAHAAVLGEARYGAGCGFRRVIGVTLGTGCGSAFVVDGAVVTQGEGVPAEGWLYPFPVNGVSADDVFSTRGLQARLTAAGLAADLPMAARAARGGDRHYQAVFAAFGADLGQFLQPFAAAFQADSVLILGGIANAFGCFEAAMRPSLSQPLCVGELEGWAALLGVGDLFFRDA